MNNIRTILTAISLFLILLTSCNKKDTAIDLLKKTIYTIDTIESIYYKQDMMRTNPQNIHDTIFRYREMYFKRLTSDSIVGVKGHWYMYVNDKENIVYEDIYDGNKLIRKNNRDSLARIYDLEKYPDFKRKHFWGHNTLYGMQAEFKFALDNLNFYSIKRLNDTVIDSKDCYQILITLKNKFTMPGFASKLENSEGRVSETKYFIDKHTNYPIRMLGVSYSIEDPGQKLFIDQTYYDIKFNLEINEDEQFNVTDKSIEGYIITEMTPK